MPLGGGNVARKRMIDPNIWQSEDFSKLSLLAKIVFIGMFSNADDHGYGRAKPSYLKSIIFPYEENMRISEMDKTLNEIASSMSVVFYLDDENEYYSLMNWSKWQRVDRPTPSRIPALSDNSTIIRRSLDDCSTNARRSLVPSIVKDSIDKIRLDKINIDQYFESFWSCYPKKIGKGKAKEKFIILANNNDPETIIKGASAYAEWCNRNQQEPQFIPHPTTWLNQERWSDELIDKALPTVQKTAWQTEREVRGKEQDEAAERLKAMLDGGGGGLFLT